jgi:hypothetical protein
VTCNICNERIVDMDTAPMGTPEGPGTCHRACVLRAVTGGIGHLIAHDYWCTQMGDPDAGLTPRQSALLVDEYVNVVGLQGGIHAEDAVPADA